MLLAEPRHCCKTLLSLWCSSIRRLSQLPNSSIVVAGANVHPVSTVRDLGVYTYSENRFMLFCRSSPASSSPSICHLGLFSFAIGVTHPLDTRLWKLRPGQAVRLPAYLQQQFQSVLNAAARLVFRLRCYGHITAA